MLSPAVAEQSYSHGLTPLESGFLPSPEAEKVYRKFTHSPFARDVEPIFLIPGSLH